MKTFEVGIIGGTGGIGKWFADFFTEEGYTVHVSGRRTGMDMKQMAKQCRVVIVSVPIGVTCDVIEQVGPCMKEESLLMDFTSLKEKPVQAMLQHSASEVIGCHPLFGPDIDSIDGHSIVFCPGRIKKWSNWPKYLFEKKGTQTIIMTPENHDEMMAIIQGLNHFNTIMLELALRNTGVDRSELKKYSTPIFDTKLSIIDKVCTTDPRLHAEILTLNPYLNSILDLYEKNLTDLKSLIKSGDTEGVMKLIKK
ncbi:MAG: prephenate dehydrogenase/arogenate dehydrogenase family protein [Deltaproteobacteria bacterium]|nr:prephenate dehydrogenase/arogenate dehydrogenase family protein [Deltaproteobacteria bacterium]